MPPAPRAAADAGAGHSRLATAAVMLGGLMIWGLQPGPLLFVEQKDFVWGLIASMYLGNVVGPRHRAGDGAAVRRDPAHPVLDHRAGDRGGLRDRRLHDRAASPSSTSG
jgi:hypothetical protein